VDTTRSLLKETRLFNPPAEFSRRAHIKSHDEYRQIYENSIKDPPSFWAEKTEEVTWFKKWDNTYSWDRENAICRWFEGGKLNAAYNCLDRHLQARGDRIAILWENEIGDTESYTYRQLHSEVCRFANVLRGKGIRKGDMVAIYMPMVPQLVIAMLACARIGAVHNVIFTGFSADSIRYRIQDSSCKMVITADSTLRGGKTIPVKENIDRALDGTVESVIVYDRANVSITMKEGRDSLWHEEGTPQDCEPEIMDAEDPLFILYAGGGTGEPVGMLHTTGGYLMYVMQTFKWVFDYRDGDICWCTEDCGWITGHSYTVYGPLACGATVLMYEGAPTYPEPERFWELIEKYRVTTLYTTPTIIRALERWGDELPKARDLSGLRILGTGGGQIEPEDWIWYYNTVGNRRCPVVDTWSQTEAGGILIAPLPGAVPLKPGSVAFPFPGIEPAVLRPDGTEADANEEGMLVIKKPWPGMMRTIYGDHLRFKEMYFARFPDMYYTGDSARRDEDGYFWITGRNDEVIRVSGYRLGTAEIEGALLSYPAVAEAAVVGYPHMIKGESIYAFVVLKEGVSRSSGLKDELRDGVRSTAGPIAVPEKIQFTDALPRAIPGGIARRALKKIASGDIDRLGDLSDIENPSTIEELIKERE